MGVTRRQGKTWRSFEDEKVKPVNLSPTRMAGVDEGLAGASHLSRAAESEKTLTLAAGFLDNTCYGVRRNGPASDELDKNQPCKHSWSMPTDELMLSMAPSLAMVSHVSVSSNRERRIGNG